MKDTGRIHYKGRLRIQILLSLILLFVSCITRKNVGTIPVYMDQYVYTTEERRFELKDDIECYIIEYQKSYDCIIDTIRYNATAILSCDSKFLTIYDPCQQSDFKKGDRVIVKPIVLTNKDYTDREIYKPFPQNAQNYPLWECLSCKYENAFGIIEVLTK